MAVNHVITHGFGTGTLAGTIALSITHGFSIAAVVTPTTPAIRTVAPASRDRVIVPGARTRTIIASDQ